MSYKIVQGVAPITGATVGTPVIGNAISLKTGTLRVSCSTANAYVAITTGIGATTTDFHLVTSQPEVLKERVARQQISGITTGTTTVVHFGENYGNPFIAGDYVSVEEATTTGINTSHVVILQKSNSSITINHNSTSVVGVITVTNAVVARSVKVSALGEGGTANVFVAEVQIASQA
jgi:hypothetical protein